MKNNNLIKYVILDIFHMIPLAFFITIIVTIIEICWNTISPKLLSALLDSIVLYKENEIGLFFIHSISYCALFAISQVVQIIGSVIDNNEIYEKCGYILNQRLINRINNLPLVYLENPNIVEKIQRAKLSLSEESIQNIWRNIIDISSHLICLIGMIVTLYNFSAYTVPLVFLGTIPILFMQIIHNKYSYKLKTQQSMETCRLDDIWNLFMDPRLIKENTVFDNVRWLKSVWLKLNKKLLREQHILKCKYLKTLLGINFLEFICHLISTILFLFLANKNIISIGQLGACFFAFANAQHFSESVFVKIGRLNNCISYAKDYYYITKLKVKSENRIPLNSNSIELRNISFSYPLTGKCVLNKINIKINSGEKILIIGNNGSGKTTLAKIILGLYSPSNGVVIYGGEGENHVTSQSHKLNNATMISQEFTRYKLTIRDNIAVANMQKINDDISITKCIKMMGATKILNSNTLDSRLGREFNGRELSEGEWQRIALSRGCFKNGDILLMDEPTSTIDANSEYNLLKAFANLSKDKTAIFISHRLSLCHICDKIYFMENGAIIESGTHSQLMKKHGKYEHYYLTQKKWYDSQL